MKHITPFVFLISIMIVVSCYPNTNTNNRGTITEEKQMTETIIYETSVLKQTTATKLLTPSVSTKSDQEREYFVREMYITNGDCKFPCIWGISPGDNVQNVLDKFSPYELISGYSDVQGDDFSIHVFPPEDIDFYSRGEWDIGIRNNGGIVETVSGKADYLSFYTNDGISALINDLGSPSEIWLLIIPESMDEPYYQISLFYADMGVRIGWRGSIEEVLSSQSAYTVSICPNKFVNEIDMNSYIPPYFLTWSSQEKLTFNEVSEKYSVVEPYFLLTKQNSDIDIENFYEIYIDTKEIECFHYTEYFATK